MDRRLFATLFFCGLLAGCGGGTSSAPDFEDEPAPPEDTAPAPPVTAVTDLVYVANNINGAGTLSAYAMDPTTGSLREVTGSPFAAGANPNAVVADLSGKFVYAANSVSGSISGYTISASGARTRMAGSPFFSPGGVRSLAIVPSGKFLYATTLGVNLSAYSIDASSGQLTAVATPADFSKQGIACIALHPSKPVAYVANGGPSASNDVTVYSLDVSSGAFSANSTLRPAWIRIVQPCTPRANSSMCPTSARARCRFMRSIRSQGRSRVVARSPLRLPFLSRWNPAGGTCIPLTSPPIA